MPHKTAQSPRASVVVPCYNAERTVAQCVEACLQQDYEGLEIIFVDDGSTDSTLDLLQSYDGITVLSQENSGPAAARNLGWRSSSGQIVCFTDSDCLPSQRWVSRLVRQYTDPSIGGVGGGYDIANRSSWLARCIQAEIQWRHMRMPQRVNYLGSFNVSYRRSVLEQLEGFDESFQKASGEDNDLSYRVIKAGYALLFAARNCVAHHHPEKVWGYLRQQYWHGYWRVRLYVKQPDRAGGDDYAGLLDLLQPPLALLAGLAWAFSWAGWPGLLSAAVLSMLLLGAQLPMIWGIVRKTTDFYRLPYTLVTAVRALARGLGMFRAMTQSSLGDMREMLTVAMSAIVSRRSTKDALTEGLR